MKKPTGFTFKCDGCGETDETDGSIPDGWRRIRRKDYCAKCSVLRDRKTYEKFPSSFIVHTPQGPHHACPEHARQVSGLFGFMGAHTVSEISRDRVACVNCVNESKEAEKEAARC
jgi:hypothetical protein